MTFLANLRVLSRLTGFDLDDGILEFYQRCLEPYGWDRVNEALQKMSRTVKRWPTVAEIEETMGITMEKPVVLEDHARDAVSRIWEACSKFGWTRPKEAQLYIGELGWKVVERFGGWGRVTDIETDEVPTLNAQFRDLAISLHKISAHKESYSGPALPKASPLGEALAIVGDLSVDRKDVATIA